MSRLDELNPAAVDAEIVRLMDALEDATETYREANQRAAESEARFKYRYARAYIDTIEERPGRQATATEREARAELETADEHSAYLISKAAAASAKEALSSIRTQIDAVRTLAANHRTLGGQH
jgi:sulfite reductase beta subunit-like hemoprotein